MNEQTNTKQLEPIKGTFILLKDGSIIEKYEAKNVEDAYQTLASKIPLGLGKLIKRDHRAVGEMMIGSHIFEIKPLLI